MRCYQDVDKWVVVEVVDTGCGIKPENIKRAFEPFWQEDPSATRSYEGSGLGLAISKKLIELHGGTITIESKLGEGTKASFRLQPS